MKQIDRELLQDDLLIQLKRVDSAQSQSVDKHKSVRPISVREEQVM
jgi:hypothetical protein